MFKIREALNHFITLHCYSLLAPFYISTECCNAWSSFDVIARLLIIYTLRATARNEKPRLVSMSLESDWTNETC